MADLKIDFQNIPSLEGKTALIFGGASGIGLATAILFARKNASVFCFDTNPPLPTSSSPNESTLPPSITFLRCNQTCWTEIVAAFKHVRLVNIVIACAGISEVRNYFDDEWDAYGNLLQPDRGVLDVNLVGTINVVKMAVSSMRRQYLEAAGARGRGDGGSIVIVSSATAYSPEHSLPVYSACKLALVGLVRALRAVTLAHDITINTVAPAATITPLLPKHLAAPIIAAGLPVSNAEHVALAIAWSAVGMQERRVEEYGNDEEEGDGKHVGSETERWHGRCILTLGDRFTELEGPIADMRPSWFGERNTRDTREQQRMTDTRVSAIKLAAQNAHPQ